MGVLIDFTSNLLQALAAIGTVGLVGCRRAAVVTKLAQYPSGTTFWLTTFGPPELLAPVLREIDEAGADHGLVVERAAQR
jgi:hypothetical protein